MGADRGRPCLQVARQEAEALARLDGRARQNDAAHFFVAQGGDGHDDGQVRLARARRADAERDGIMADRVEIEALSERCLLYTSDAADDRV